MNLLPWSLAYSRLRRYLLHSLSISLVVALALLSLLAIQGISHSTVNSHVNYSLAKIPEGDRTLTVTSNQIMASETDFKSVSHTLAKDFLNLASGELTREILYHQLADSHGVGFYFGAADDLTHSLSLNSGRFPNFCSPSACEVIQIGNGNPPQLASFGIKIVGIATIGDGKLFSGTFAPDGNVPLYLANGVANATSVRSLSKMQGANGWVGTINRRSIERVGLDTYINSVVIFENRIAIDQPGLSLTWPQDALTEANSEGAALRTKFVLLDYTTGAFLTILLALFSIRRKVEHLHFRSGLSRIGTPKNVLAKELAIEYSAPIFLGILLGLVLSPLISLLLHLFNFQVGFLELFGGQGQNALFFFFAFLLSVGIAIYGDKVWGKWPTLIFALGILTNFLYFALRGASDSRVWVLPLLGVAIPLWTSYLLLPRITSLLRRRASETFILIRENMGMWQGVAAIISLTTLLGVITLSFDSGISREVNLQAEDRVPLNILIKTGSSLVRPLDRGGIAEYENLVPGAKAFPILRTGASIRTAGAISDSLVLLGMSPAALSRASNTPLRKLATIISPETISSEPGVNIGSSSAISVELKNIPQEVDILGWFKTPRGYHSSFAFAGHGRDRTLRLTGNVPRNSLLTAFELRETSEYVSRRLHALGEGTFSVSLLKGLGGIPLVAMDGRPLDLQGQGWNIATFPYSFDGNSLYLRPRWDTKIPTVVTDPTTAALGTTGILTLSSEGNSSFQVRVGAVRKRFPSAGDRFVIMDLNELQSEFSRSTPGSADPIELWISTNKESSYISALRNSIFRDANYSGRIAEKEKLRENPTNIGLDAGYKVSLLYALLVSMFLLGMALPLMRKDGAAGLFQLEVGGAGPNSLRKALRESLRVSLLVGMSIGLGFGVLVTQFYLSQSTPVITILLTLFAALSLSEIGTRAITRRFFGERTMFEVG